MNGFEEEPVEGQRPGTSPGTYIRQEEGGWAMAMIVAAFNEVCVDPEDRATEARRAAGRTRMLGHSRLPKARSETPATNWSSWFAHYHGPREVAE